MHTMQSLKMPNKVTNPNYAYITILTTESYLDGVGALMLSLKKTKTEIPFYILCGPQISQHTIDRLNSFNYAYILRYQTSIPFPESIATANNNRQNTNWNHTFDKLLIFELTQFKKMVFIDADMMVTQNLDHLFALPHMSATNAGFSFPGNENDIDLNSGLMVIEPQPDIVERMLAMIPSIIARKDAFGDQDVLQAYYIDWTSRPELNFGEKYNVYANHLDYYINKLGYHFNSDVNDSKSIAIVHFIGASKPWHARWNTASVIYQDLRLLFHRCIGRRDAEWAKLEYKHLIRTFRKKR